MLQREILPSAVIGKPQPIKSDEPLLTLRPHAEITRIRLPMTQTVITGVRLPEVRRMKAAIEPARQVLQRREKPGNRKDGTRAARLLPRVPRVKAAQPLREEVLPAVVRGKRRPRSEVSPQRVLLRLDRIIRVHPYEILHPDKARRKRANKTVRARIETDGKAAARRFYRRRRKRI